MDIWRQENPETHKHTWKRKNPSLIQSRLDFFLVSFGIVSCIEEADIIPGFKSDHSAITLKIGINTQPRGPGFWKLNCSFLQDNEYVNMVNNIFENARQTVETEDPILIWEMLKLKIRSETMKYAAKKKKAGKIKLTI